MWARLLILSLCLLSVLPLAGQTYATIVASQIGDASGQNLLASGQLCYAPVDSKGNPIAARAGGQINITPVCSQVVTGVLQPPTGHSSFQLANTANTYPSPICFQATLTDNSDGSSIYPTGAGTGYSCVQMNNTWCTTSGGVMTCNWDNFPPNSLAQAPLSAPTLAIGAVTTGASGSTAAASISGTIPNYLLNLTLPAGPAGPNCATGSPVGTCDMQGVNMNDLNTVAAGVPISSSAPSGVYGLSPAALAQTVVRDFLSRVYSHVIVVHPGTSVTTTINGISGATAMNRYLVYILNGTYTGESVQCKDYVDAMGQSRTGVILTNTSEAGADTMDCTTNTVVSNMTIQNLVNSGDNHSYPIHADGLAESIPTVTAFINVEADSLGNYPSGFGGIGIGARASQTFYVINSTGTGTNVNGILAHNVAGQSGPTGVYLINSKGISTNGCGFQWSNVGSGQPDMVQVVGGTYTGGANCGTPNAGIFSTNVGGTGEAIIGVEPSTNATVSIAAGTGTQIAGLPIVRVPSVNYINGPLWVNGSLRSTTWGNMDDSTYVNATVDGQFTITGGDLLLGGTHKIVVPNASVFAGSFSNVAGSCYFDPGTTSPGHGLLYGCDFGTTGSNGINSAAALRGTSVGDSTNTRVLWLNNANQFTFQGGSINTQSGYDINSAAGLSGMTLSLSPTATSFTGTSGTASCSEGLVGTQKYATCILTGYAQTGTAQTYAFPTAYSTTPVVSNSGCGTYNATATATTLTLPANAAMTTESCSIAIIGQ